MKTILLCFLLSLGASLGGDACMRIKAFPITPSPYGDYRTLYVYAYGLPVDEPVYLEESCDGGRTWTYRGRGYPCCVGTIAWALLEPAYIPAKLFRVRSV